MRWVVIDFETASATDLKASGAWRYAECPTTEILCLAYETSAPRTSGLWLPGHDDAVLRALVDDPNTWFVAHNAGFEKAIWRRIMVDQHGWPDIPNKRWHDTLAMAAMRAIPQDLDHAIRVLRLPALKDNEGSKHTKGLSKSIKRGPRKGYLDRSEVSLQKVYDYCVQDIRAEVALHNRLGWLPPGERSVWLLDQRINERGIRLDVPFIAAARQVVDKASVPLAHEFATLTGGLKMSQRDKVLAWCKGQGTTLPDMKKETLARLLGSDEEADDEDFEEDPDALEIELPDNVRRALEIRQLIGSASIKKLGRMEKCICADGRARGLVQYHGAGTGRWAGRLFQPHNFPRGTIKLGKKAPPPEMLVQAILTADPEYVEMMFGPPVEVVVSSLRHAIVASPGRGLVAGDFAGIEARVVLALAGQHDKTALMASGADVYLDSAEDTYGAPKGSFGKETHADERQLGKETVLGAGFQMGWRKFLARCRQKGIELTEEQAQKAITGYRKVWAPKVPDLWYGLEGAAVRCVHDRRVTEAYGIEFRLEDLWLTARLPSGRKLWYFNPQPTTRAMPWDETDVRLAWTYQVKKAGRWITVDSYGGLLTENVVQAIARDIMAHAMFNCEREGLPVILTVHDEIITEPERNKVDDKLLAQVMQSVPEWCRDMQVPVKAEAWAGDRYKK